MMAAQYQHSKSEMIEVSENETKTIAIKVVVGGLNKKYGIITAQTSVNVFMGSSNGEGEMEIELPEYHNALVYLLDGELMINDTLNLKKGATQFVTFDMDGDTIKIASKGESNFLILSGEPINEKLVQHGPYVMNSQTEIMEAMRDFNMGKMGYLY
jgi:redox-sensitive bicupin YhaK (pirin superfamily)